MKINRLIFKNSNYINSNMQKGAIIRGKLVNTEGNIIKLDLGYSNYIIGKSEIPLDDYKGQIVDFLIKTIDNNKIIMTPIFTKSHNSEDKTLFIESILGNINIEPNDRVLAIVEYLMKNNMAINKETIEKILRIVNKIEILLNLNQNQDVQLINNIHPLNEEIGKLLIVECSNYNENEKILSNKDNIGTGLELFTKTNNTLAAVNIETKDLIVKELKQLISQNHISSDIIRNIVFLVKTNIEVSINNLKFLGQLIEEGNFISSDIEELIIEIKNNDTINNKLKDEIRSFPTGIELGFDVKKDVLNIKNYYQKILDIIQNVKKHLDEADNFTDKIKTRLEILEEKINFINRLNQNDTIVYIPVKCEQYNIDDKIFLLNKNKKRKKLNNIKIFISLETKNLKNVELLGNISSNYVKLDFRLDSIEVIEYFKFKRDKLYSILKGQGFSNIIVNFDLKKDKINPLDILVDEGINCNSINIRV